MPLLSEHQGLLQFSSKTKEKLQCYVYGLVDPRSGDIFYVGKASANNRAFDHLKSTDSESQKAQRIADIRASNREPRVEILRYGLAEPAALEVEAAIIDTLGLDRLTNAVRGHGVEKGRMPAEVVERLYGAKPVMASEITEPCMVFFIHNTYSPTQSEQEIYDSVRQFWHQVGEETRRNLQYRLALGVVEGVVIRAYSIEAWFPAGATFSSRSYTSQKPDRWEFVGQRREKHELLGRLLVDNSNRPIAGVQKGYTYLGRK